jgi:surfactin synthase thioesterase subunit
MERSDHSDDRRAIAAIIERQFASLGWSPGRSADWRAFGADFFAEASLYPAARPARRQTVERFVERMKGLAGTKLRSFEERVLGTEIHIFGNVAVALAACEITENDTEASRGVEALLLVKDEGAWRIVSQAWDTESDAEPVPEHLRAIPDET